MEVNTTWIAHRMNSKLFFQLHPPLPPPALGIQLKNVLINSLRNTNIFLFKDNILSFILDSGTLTTDTEIIRMSHCGAFYFDDR
jgi:hypothetical protein